MSHIFRDHLWPDTHDHIATPIPEPPAASACREKFPCPQELGEGEVGRLIDKLKVGKAADRDQVINELLKLTKNIILPYLEHLFRACIALSHVPERFKIAMTIMLRKPRKETYTVPESWRPIALLSSIGKLLERLTANRLRDLCVKYDLLPATQFGVAGRCNTKAMRYILNPVYSAWCRKLQATLMSLDIKGAFNRVGRKKILGILAKRGIPYWIIKIVWSFLSDRRTTLDMPGHSRQGLFFVNVGIPQGSPLSPILFTLFAAPLLDSLAKYTGSKSNKFALAFVDDTYLLVVSKTHRYNCRLLRQLHDVVMAWADENEVIFEQDKYSIMHFQKPGSRREEVSDIPNIPGLDIRNVLKTEIRVLGVWMDSRLTWQKHVEEISAKAKMEMCRLARISKSICGPTLIRMRQLYLAKVRPMLAYGCGAWFLYGPDVKWRLSNRLIKKLESTERVCLRQIAGAFKQTSYECLLKELYIEPLETFLETRALAFLARAMGPRLRVKCRVPVGSSRSSDSKPLEQHPYTVLERYARELWMIAQERLTEANNSKPQHSKVAHKIKDWNHPKVRAAAINASAREAAHSKSSKMWMEYRVLRQVQRKNDRPAFWTDWGKNNLVPYRDLTRPQSSILLQCRTGVIGLNAFLYGCNAVDTDECVCGERQTAKHLFCFCPELTAARSVLRRTVGHTDFRYLMWNNAKEAADWAICFFGVPQYDWTRLNIPNTFTEAMNRLEITRRSYEEAY